MFHVTLFLLNFFLSSKSIFGLAINICNTHQVAMDNTKYLIIDSPYNTTSKQYYANLNCTLQLINYNHSGILIEIVYLLIEFSPGCLYRDYLSITFDNETKPSYYCGNIYSKYVTTNSSVVTFQFRSDPIIENTGFMLSVNLLENNLHKTDFCQQFMFITNYKILISSKETIGETIDCSGTIFSTTGLGVVFEIKKLDTKSYYQSCHEEYIKFDYFDYFLNETVEKYFCGFIDKNIGEPILVAYGTEIKFSAKFQMSGELNIEYRPIIFPENVYSILSKVSHIELSKLPESLTIDLNNKLIFAENFSYKHCLFAFKIQAPLGMGINVVFSQYNVQLYRAYFMENFINQVNFLTIREMKILNTSEWSTESFQITLVIRYFNCNSNLEKFNLRFTLKQSNLMIDYPLINTILLGEKWWEWINKANYKRTIQITNYINPPKQDMTFYYIRINKLILFNQNHQDYSCNQTGLYLLYDNSSKRFGPFCHSTDFIPLEKLPTTIAYYYFPTDEIKFGSENKTNSILEILLEFYPCKISSLQTSYIVQLQKCLIFYQPVTNQPINSSNKVILIRANENVTLFKMHTRLSMNFEQNIISLNKPIHLPIIQSNLCYFGFVLSQNVMNSENYLMLLEINSNCSYIPHNWSIHLELASRRRIECNSVNNIPSGIISLNSSTLSNVTYLDLVIPICTWHFKRPNYPTVYNSVNMLLLEIDVFNLDCKKYTFHMFEKIGDTVHKLNLCDNVKHGDLIYSKSDGDIYLSLKSNYLSNSWNDLVPQYHFDDLVIFFKYVSVNFTPVKMNCEDGWWKYDKSCYKFEKRQLDISWNDSLEICKTYNSKLVQISNRNEMEFLRNISLSRWLSEIYSNTSVVIFIGLRNHITMPKDYDYVEDLYPLTWTKDEPLTYHEWFQRSPSKTYAFLSNSLKGIINSILLQPTVEKNGHFCTAMMMQHPLYWSNWVKIPCESKISSASFICQKPQYIKNSKYYFTKELEKINDMDGVRCSENWFFIEKRCLMLIKINDFEKSKSYFCELKNSTLAFITGKEILRTTMILRQFLTVNKDTEMYYQDKSGEKIVPSISYSFKEEPRKGYVICERSSQTIKSLINASKEQINGFWCGEIDAYWIGIDKVCDFHIDCLISENDEKDCIVKVKSKPMNEFQQFLPCNRNDNQFISWNRYCDFIEDCKNGTDEKLCSYSRCAELTEWQCQNKQCIDVSKRCNKVSDCIDNSDEKDCDICNGFKCLSSLCIASMFEMDDIVDCPGSSMEDEIISKEDCYKNPAEIKSLCSSTSNKCFQSNNTCLYHSNNLLSRDACPLLEHLQNCISFQCPGLFQCSKMKYCIELHYVCDGTKDCPDGEDEDEESCKTLKCPYNFRCWSFNHSFLLCLNHKDLCNGISDCSEGEDEQYCDIFQCPTKCKCFGYQILCQSSLSINISILNPKTRTLTIVQTHSLELSSGIFSQFIYLGYLNISDNSILELYNGLFDGLFNLRYLILSKNYIRILPSYTFQFLKQLQILDITDNPITTIESFAFHNLISITHIELPSMKLYEINDYTFLGMSENLISINMSNNDIRSISQDSFVGVNNLSTLVINVNKNDIAMSGKPLKHLTVKNVYTNVYKICCSLASYGTCSAKSDISSNCEDLLANKSIQVFVWTMGICGLVGNIMVIIWRISVARKKKFSTEDILIVNLAISDMFMGIYLIIIASADKYYRSQYIENSIYWKSSVACSVAGYFATVSNQSSVTFIGLITLDRFICIIFRTYRQHASKIKYLVFLVWFVWVISIALFQHFYHSKMDECESSGLCLSYFSFKYECSFKQNFSIMLLLYILLFIFLIVTGYVLIFFHSCRTRRTAGRILMLNDYKSAKKLLTLILPCILCWIPIIILSFLSRFSNYLMESDQLTWLTAVLMPINSSINPYLYTFSNVNLFIKSKINNSKQNNYPMHYKN